MLWRKPICKVEKAGPKLVLELHVTLREGEMAESISRVFVSLDVVSSCI